MREVPLAVPCAPSMVMFSMRPSGDSGVRLLRTNLHISALPHQFQWRRLSSKVTFE
jgi:hypothetical protein